MHGTVFVIVKKSKPRNDDRAFIAEQRRAEKLARPFCRARSDGWIFFGETSGYPADRWDAAWPKLDSGAPASTWDMEAWPGDVPDSALPNAVVFPGGYVSDFGEEELTDNATRSQIRDMVDRYRSDLYVCFVFDVHC